MSYGMVRNDYEVYWIEGGLALDIDANSAFSAATKAAKEWDLADGDTVRVKSPTRVSTTVWMVDTPDPMRRMKHLEDDAG